MERERGKATLHVPDRLVRQASAGVVVYNEGNMKKNILIGHPTLGSIRNECQRALRRDSALRPLGY